MQMNNAMRFVRSGANPFKTLIATICVAVALGAEGVVNVRAGEEPSVRSRWDLGLLNVKLRNVHIQASSLAEAWQQIGMNYLLRTCLFQDITTESDSNEFTFERQSTTCREVLNALASSYPDYTYSQDDKTGITWIHRKAIPYSNVLDSKIKIDHTAIQVPMCIGVLIPLQSELGWLPYPVFDKPWMATFNYGVDLQRGVFSVRDIINICCTGDVTTGFWISMSPEGRLVVQPWHLITTNPFVPPREAAVDYWRTEVDQNSSEIPTLDKIGLALADSNRRIRWAAVNYLRATPSNYRTRDLIEEANDEHKMMWAALQLKRLETAQEDFPYLTKFLNGVAVLQNALTDYYDKLSPGLALLVSMELARERNDVSDLRMSFSHRFSLEETASVKADLIRIARASKLVRTNLAKMTFDDPELAPETWQGLDETNLFKVVSPSRN